VEHVSEVIVGVSPQIASSRPRLLDALAAFLPVRFEVLGGPDAGALRAVIALEGSAETVPADVPTLMAGAERTLDADTARAPIAFASDVALDRRLHGAALIDGHVGGLRLRDGGGERVLAERHGVAVWTCAGVRQRVAALPDELGPGEALRDRLEPGRSVAMLVLVHHLRQAAAEHLWTAPPLRASFVFDDPNLHWPTYGHLNYADVAVHAREHGYHLAVAMVPLDGWLVHPNAARTFRESAAQLSVLVHGNDHIGHELARATSAAEADRTVRLALRRMATFEARAGLQASRVMAPPHERVGAATMGALERAGFEGVCMTRPYPWLQGEGMSWLTRPEDSGPLVAFTPHEVVGGLPVLMRRGLDSPREELVLRAFLDQPLILYGHHEDVADGLDRMAAAARDINRLAEDVAWGSLSDVTRSSVRTRREGGVLHVRPDARRVRITVPDGVNEVRLAPSALLNAEASVSWRRTGETWTIGKHLTTVTEGDVIEARIGPVAPAVQARGAASLTMLWPLARRAASESRDRIRPLTHRALRRSA
jgi:hypothetical protein